VPASSTVRVVLHPLHVPGTREALDGVDGVELLCPDDSDLPAALASASVLVTYRWEDHYLVSSLRWIQSLSAGVDQFPLDRLADAGVVLTSARGVNAPAVAEHAFALLLALTRGVGASVRRAGEWRPLLGEEIGGRTMAVVGLGAVGEEVARRAAAWGLRVVGVKRRPDDYRGVAERVVGPDRLGDVLAEADIAVVALPETAETRRVIDARALRALGRGWVINVGRGSAVDVDALLAALERDELAGVGLDVTDPEPLPADHPLWAHPRVVITPHIAGLTPRFASRFVPLFVANLDAFRGRGEWTNRVV